MGIGGNPPKKENGNNQLNDIPALLINALGSKYSNYDKSVLFKIGFSIKNLSI